jgi:hypothetical protein
MLESILRTEQTQSFCFQVYSAKARARSLAQTVSAHMSNFPELCREDEEVAVT